MELGVDLAIIELSRDFGVELGHGFERGFERRSGC